MNGIERLKVIKSVSEFQIDNDSYYGRPANVTLKGDDVKWLIEQAGIAINTSKDKHALIKSNIALNKRVQELEEERSEWKGTYSVLKNKYRALQRKMKNRWRYNRALENESRTNEIVLEEFREQNKRYREALEKIKLNVKICGNEEYFPKVVEEIVNEALEG